MGPARGSRHGQALRSLSRCCPCAGCRTARRITRGSRRCACCWGTPGAHTALPLLARGLWVNKPNLFMKCRVCCCTASRLPPARAAVADAPGELCCGTSFLITREMSTAIAELRVYPSRLSGGAREAWDQQQGMGEAGWVWSPPSCPPKRRAGCLVGGAGGARTANRAEDVQ